MARLEVPKVVCGGIKRGLWLLHGGLTQWDKRLLLLQGSWAGVGREGLLQVLGQARPVPGLIALPDLEGRLGHGLVNLDWQCFNMYNGETNIQLRRIYSNLDVLDRRSLKG